MYYVYSDGELIAETTDWEAACDTAIMFGGYVVDSDDELLFCSEDSDPTDGEISFDDDCDYDLGFNPYMGCFDFDC